MNKPAGGKAECSGFKIVLMKDRSRLVTFDFDMAKVKHLPSEVILGRISDAGKKIVFSDFLRNSSFVSFLVRYRNKVIYPELLAEAKRIKNGLVFVFDRRLKDLSGDVPPCEIIGAYTVRDGKVVPDSFSYNPNHKILCEEHGVSVLFDELKETAEKLVY